MNYCIGDISFVPSDELYHHGIKGQKWGVRRYQNEDGSLTAEGKERYGNSETFKKGTIGNILQNLDRNRHVWKEHTLEEKIKKAKASGNKEKQEKAEAKLEKTRTTYANLKAYQEHTSLTKMLIQDYLLTPIAAQKYREARADGHNRASSLIRSSFTCPITRVYQMVRGEDYRYKTTGSTLTDD